MKTINIVLTVFFSLSIIFTIVYMIIGRKITKIKEGQNFDVQQRAKESIELKKLCDIINHQNAVIDQLTEDIEKKKIAFQIEILKEEQIIERAKKKIDETVVEINKLL